MVQFSQRLLDTAEIQPDRCLTIDHALDRAGYPNLTVGLINKINGDDPIFTFDVEMQDFTHLAIEHFPASALTRIVCMAAYPKEAWSWTKGEGALKLGDDDRLQRFHTTYWVGYNYVLGRVLLRLGSVNATFGVGY